MHRKSLYVVLFFPLFLMLLVVACTPESDVPGIVQLADQPIDTPDPSTATATLTLIPTYVVVSPTPTATLTPTPVVTTEEDVQIANENAAAVCSAVIENLYETSGELCLGGPAGYVCNGGLPPRVEPSGPLSSAISVAGSLIDVAELDSIQTAPVPSNNSGGVAWIRLQDQVELSGLMIGDVQLRDVTPDDSTFAPWQSMTVETSSDETAQCEEAPYSSFVIQGLLDESTGYMVQTSVVINGTSVELDGTMVIQTRENETLFIMLEGLGRVTAYGQAVSLFPGQQLAVSYTDGDFTRPSAIPGDADPLEYDLIRNLPVALLDQIVLLPQPGYVGTQGVVNMRAEPDVESTLLYSVPAGQVMSVLGKDSTGEWYHIRLGNGETGWMSAELLVQRTGIIEAVYDSTPEPPHRLGELNDTAIVKLDQGGNLRQAPDTSFPILATVPQGTEVTLLARSPYSYWVKVEADGAVGWMSLITLETRAAVNFLPIDYVAQLPSGATEVPDFSGGHAYPSLEGGY